MVTEAQINKVAAWWCTVAKIDEARGILMFVPGSAVTVEISKRVMELEELDERNKTRTDGDMTRVAGTTWANDMIKDHMDSGETFDGANKYCFVLGVIPDHEMEWVKKRAKRVWTLDASDNVVQIHGPPMHLFMDGSRALFFAPV